MDEKGKDRLYAKGSQVSILSHQEDEGHTVTAIVSYVTSIIIDHRYKIQNWNILLDSYMKPCHYQKVRRSVGSEATYHGTKSARALSPK
jgi:hypothetical protein